VDAMEYSKTVDISNIKVSVLFHQPSQPVDIIYLKRAAKCRRAEGLVVVVDGHYLAKLPYRRVAKFE
jgi:hypothetical protein